MLVVKYDSTVLSSDVSLKLKTRLPPYWCTISVNMACDPACNEFVVKKQLKEINKNRMLMLSEYAEKLDGNVKKRHVEKISKVGVNPALIPDHKLDPECFPPIEASDLLPYLVLDTSYYTNSLKTSVVYKLTTRWCLVSSVVFKELFFRKKHVIVAKVSHSQRMNDPLVTLWIIANKDGSILTAHCIGCMAGLGECCSYIASVLFYVEFWTRVNGKLSCTQVKCTWILPTYVKEVNYSKIPDINFSSARNLEADLEKNLESLDPSKTMQSQRQSKPVPIKINHSIPVEKPSRDKLNGCLASLSECDLNSVALSLVKPYSDSFVLQSRHIPTITYFKRNF